MKSKQKFYSIVAACSAAIIEVNNRPAINNLSEPNEERSRKRKNKLSKDGEEWSECESLVSVIMQLTQLRLTSGHHTRCYHCLTRREERSVARHSLFKNIFI